MTILATEQLSGDSFRTSFPQGGVLESTAHILCLTVLPWLKTKELAALLLSKPSFFRRAPSMEQPGLVGIILASLKALLACGVLRFDSSASRTLEPPRNKKNRASGNCLDFPEFPELPQKFSGDFPELFKSTRKCKYSGWYRQYPHCLKEGLIVATRTSVQNKDQILLKEE